jgi:hypothetical protein
MSLVDVNVSIIDKTDTFHSFTYPPVLLPLIVRSRGLSLAAAAQMLFSLRVDGWMDGWMDGLMDVCMLLLLLPARNKQIFARPRLNRLLRRISGKLKLKVFALRNILPLIPQKPLIQLGKEERRRGGGIHTFRNDLGLDLARDLDLNLALGLPLGLPLSSQLPPQAHSLGSVAAFLNLMVLFMYT